MKALSIDEGQTEQELIALAGPPTRQVKARGDCAFKGGRRHLLYEMRTNFFGKEFGPPDGIIDVCVDGASKVIQKVMIQF